MLPKYTTAVDSFALRRSADQKKTRQENERDMAGQNRSCPCSFCLCQTESYLSFFFAIESKIIKKISPITEPPMVPKHNPIGMFPSTEPNIIPMPIPNDVPIGKARITNAFLLGSFSDIIIPP